MKVAWYSSAIRIVGATASQVMIPNQGAQWSPLQDITEDEYAKLFIAYTRSLLDKIRTLEMGRQLLTEIEQSGKRLTICLEKNGGNSTAPEAGDATVIERYFKPFRPYKPQEVQHMRLNLGTLPAWRLTQSPTFYTQRLKSAINSSPFTQDALARLVIDELRIPRDYARQYEDLRMDPPLVSIASRMRNEPQLRERRQNLRVGVREQRLQDMIDGHAEIDDETYAKLCLYLHDYLKRGDGVNVIVGYSATGREACAENARADWEKGDVPFIILAHELIHAWRQMTGRRIFLGGVGEEHMTTGLPPYTSMKFTENKLRAQANLAMRDHYQAAVYDAFSGTLGMSWTSRQGREDTASFWSKQME